ncbi:radical SAM protein [Candidatus Woesearchaeota archaeon]|nr:radical SAM protein [Candidatus Woesearchaeota archaeon]
MAGDHVHWFLGEGCNLNCRYCFGPKTGSHNPKLTLRLAEALVENGVKQVTLGGGEPTLIKTLPQVVNILKAAGVYVSLHTNGLKIDENFLDNVRVDDIGLPIDTHDRNLQKFYRGPEFMPVFDRIHELSDLISGRNIALCYHTVFTNQNSKHMPALHKLLERHNFKYWRIYEFNIDCAVHPLLKQPSADINKLRILESMRCGTDPAGTDSLYAKFLLAEEKMPENPRIQFVGRRYIIEPYVFLDSNGDIRHYLRYSGRERPVVGNILTGNFKQMCDEIDERNADILYDEKAEALFLDASVGDMPLFGRIETGSYDVDEEVPPESAELFWHLEELHRARQERFYAEFDRWFDQHKSKI